MMEDREIRELATGLFRLFDRQCKYVAGERYFRYVTLERINQIDLRAGDRSALIAELHLRINAQIKKRKYRGIVSLKYNAVYQPYGWSVSIELTPEGEIPHMSKPRRWPIKRHRGI